MKFSCIKDFFENAVITAERFTGKNLTLPILGNILLETDDTSIRVTATNLEYAIQIIIPGKISQKGSLTVPAKILSSFIQSIKEEKINLEEKNGNLIIKTETRETKINGMPVADFPLMPKIKKTATLQIDAVSLAGGLEKIIPAVSTSEFKPELTGIFFKVASNTLYMAATDTFRLAEYKINLTKKNTEEISFILPQRVSQELVRMSSLDEDSVQISLGENQILFETKKIKIISRLIEGKFPDYRSIIPKNFETTSFLHKNEVVNAIRASSIFASKLQEITFLFRGKNFEIRAVNPEVGEHTISLPAATTGKDITISFNYRYLLDGILATDEEEIFIGLNSENIPTLIRNKSNEVFIYVVMPIRLT